MIRNLEEFNGKYKGRVCFVVGAGASLHFQDLEPLKNHITIAVNSGYVAVPWADFFVSDDCSAALWNYFSEDLVASTKTIALLYENKLSESVGLFGDRSVVFRHQKGIHIADRYDHSNKKNHIGETRTSVGTGIMIAHIMGCSKIVLIGIDGNRKFGCRYFWQLSPHISPYRTEPYKKPYRNDHEPWNRFRKVKIKGQVTDTDLVDINKYWPAFGKAVNEKCMVYNASKSSSIDVFPKVDLERFLEDHEGL